MKILVPLYVHPDRGAGEPGYVWPAFARGQRKTDCVFIVNPASGPGPAGDPSPDYRLGLGDLAAERPAGIIGYVHTTYGARPIDLVMAEVDKWDEDYAGRVTGVFVDEVPWKGGKEDYYALLARHIRSKSNVGSLIVLNPGCVCSPGYLTHGDITVTFEGTRESFQNHEAPKAEGRFAALVHTCGSPGEMKTAVRLARKRRYEFIFATDGAMPNPWGAKPAWWDALVARAARRFRLF